MCIEYILNKGHGYFSDLKLTLLSNVFKKSDYFLLVTYFVDDEDNIAMIYCKQNMKGQYKLYFLMMTFARN